jgi:aryl-alcohol dehydrogenase-like predicted oxidoreductase
MLPAMSKNQTSAEMVLGTANLGTPSGAREARLILNAAVHARVRWIETSATYGASEQRIGQALQNAPGPRIVTKLPLIDQKLPATLARHLVLDSIHKSCSRLTTNRLDVAMLNHVSLLSSHGGIVWDTLKELRNQGHIHDLGVPVASPEEALIAIADKNVRYMQLQYNALDWRWRQSGVIEALASRGDITLHAHSALMHGLLAGAPGLAPTGIDADGLRKQLWILARDLGRDCPADLCIAYVRAQPWMKSQL